MNIFRCTPQLLLRNGISHNFRMEAVILVSQEGASLAYVSEGSPENQK